MNMVEAMARAIANETEADWEATPLIHKLVFRAQARAALAAAMEPTPGMVEAGQETGPIGCCCIDYSDARAIWQAMCRAVLDEGEG